MEPGTMVVPPPTEEEKLNQQPAKTPEKNFELPEQAEQDGKEQPEDDQDEIPADTMKELLREVEQIDNISSMLDFLIKLSEDSKENDPASFLQALNRENKSNGLHFDATAAYLAIKSTSEKLVGFDDPAKATRVLKAFGGIAGKEYFSGEELGCFFDSVELRPYQNDNNFAMHSNGKLVLFTNTFENNSDQPKYSDDQLEFLILHETGHAVDASSVLESDVGDNGEAEDNSGEFDALVNQIPVEQRDQYSVDNQKHGDETVMKETKATLIAIWAKHKGDKEGFALERINRINKQTLREVFGDLRRFAPILRKAEAAKNADLLKAKAAEGKIEMLNKLIENSRDIHDYIDGKWHNAQIEMGEDFQEALHKGAANVSYEYCDYDDELTTPVGETANGKSEGMMMSPEVASSKPDGPQTKASPLQNQKNGTSLGEVFSAAGDFLVKFSGEVEINKTTTNN